MYKLKQIPSDFVVKEIQKDSFKSNLKDKGLYIYFKLKKTNWNTISAIKQVARVLKVPLKQIGFAGSKDRQAVTQQICSVKVTSRINQKSIENIKLKDIELEFLGFADKPINLGDLQGNYFEITIRNLELGKYKIDGQYFSINYFDEQRFSKNNVNIGKAVLTKDFKTATKLVDGKSVKEHLENSPNDLVGALKTLPRRNLMMYVHAYQSYLWNETVVRYLKSNQKNIREIDYSFGKLVFSDKGLKKFKDLQVPLLGFNIDLDELDSKIKEITLKILEEENIDEDNFVVKAIPFLSLEGDYRKVVVKINNLDISKLESDKLNKNKEKVLVKFSLPKGSYATMLLKQLVKKDN